MDAKRTLPVMLAMVGLIFLTGGVGAYYRRSTEAVACEACGMEVERTDPSTFMIMTPDGVTRYGCCPMCSLMIGIYYGNTVVTGRCFECGTALKVNIFSGDLSDISPVGVPYNVSVILGKSCVTRKIVCGLTCADRVRASKDWAKDLPLLPISASIQKARETVPRFTIIPRQVRIPEISYVLIGLGLTLIALSIFSRNLIYKRRSHCKMQE